MNWRRLLIIPPIAIGIGLFVLQTRPGPDVAATPAEPQPPAVRVAEVVLEPLVLEVSGFGRVAPVRSWQATSQVDGRIVALADNLAVGAVYEAGTPLIQTDPRTYEIAEARAQASLATAYAQIRELETQEEATEALLALEREIEAFQQAELDRQSVLVERGTISQAALEQAHRELLNQQRQVRDLENQLTLYPVQRLSAEAAIQTAEVDLEAAQRDLSDTVIVAPFDGRVTDQNLSVGQYVRPGDALLVLEDIAEAEIVAEVQPGALNTVVRALVPDADLTLASTDPGATTTFSLLSRFDLSATVSQRIGDRRYVWPATLDRHTGAIDPATGSVGLVVRVADPGRTDPRTGLPPLVTGSFVEVRIAIPAGRQVVMVDRAAVRPASDGAPFVYVVDENQTLQRRAILTGATLGDRIVVADGLRSGDTIVLSEPQPAILGMAVEPVYDRPTLVVRVEP